MRGGGGASDGSGLQRKVLTLPSCSIFCLPPPPPRACMCARASPCPCERADPAPRGSAAGQLPAGCRGDEGSASTASPPGRGAGPLRRWWLGQAAQRRRSAARRADAPAAGCGRRRHKRRRSICRRRAPARPASRLPPPLPACPLPSRSAPAAAKQPALWGTEGGGRPRYR